MRRLPLQDVVESGVDEFFEEYPDRIMFGTDASPNGTSVPQQDLVPAIDRLAAEEHVHTDDERTDGDAEGGTDTESSLARRRQADLLPIDEQVPHRRQPEQPDLGDHPQEGPEQPLL